MIADLAQHSRPITNFVKLPTTPAEWRHYRLSDEQVAFYHENGYLAGIRILNDAKIEQLREELQGLFDPKHPGNELFHEYHTNESPDSSKVLFHALGAWRIAPGFHDLIWHPAFTVPASQLLGGPVRFWHDQLFCKPAQHGSVVAWHQDYSYWTRTKPMAHLTCWCGLDDSSLENGCVQYVPGSHRWGLLQKPVIAGDMNGIVHYLNEAQRQQFKPVAIETKAGFGIFHHPLTLHGSGENKSKNPRRAFVINAVADGVSSDADEPLLAGVSSICKGQKLDGQFFPLLFDGRAIMQDQI